MVREFVISLLCVFAGVVLHGCGSSKTAEVDGVEFAVPPEVSENATSVNLGSVQMGAGDEQLLIMGECRSLIVGGMQDKIDSTNKSLNNWCERHTTAQQTYGATIGECRGAVDSMLDCGRQKLFMAYGPQCANDTLNANLGHGMEQITSVTDWYDKNKVRINTQTVVYMNVLGGPKGTDALMSGNVTGLCASAAEKLKPPKVTFYDNTYGKVLGSGVAGVNTVMPTTLGYAMAFMVLSVAGFSLYRANRSRRPHGGAGALGLDEAAALQQGPALDEAAEA